MTKICDVMTRDTKLINSDDTLRHAATLMRDSDCGALPVRDGDRLVGMITDRDIAIRCVAEGRGPDTRVEEAMTREVKYCFDDEDCEHVAQNLADIQLRRLPVMDREKHLVGIVSLADLARSAPETTVALRRISEPSAQHNQSWTTH